MKKYLPLLLLVLVLIVPSTSMAAQNQVIIKIDGGVLNTNGITPYIQNGTTFVPLRAISEALEYEVKWDDVNKIVTMKKDNTKVTLPVGKKEAKVNGVKKEIVQPAEIKKGNTYVPVRFVSEMIDYEVHFKKQGNKSIINIISPIEEKPVDKAKADAFVKDFIERKDYKLYKYVMADMNKDTIPDYVLLVDQGPEDVIVLLDGKDGKHLAETVVSGVVDEPRKLEVVKLLGNNTKQIYYYDGGYHEYVFNYDGSILDDITAGFERLGKIEDSHDFSYSIDYPSLNKVLCMKPTKSVLPKVNDYYYKYSYHDAYKAPKKEEALKYESHISDMSKLGELKYQYSFTFEPLGENKVAVIEHTYSWENGKFVLKNATIKSLSPKKLQVINSKYGNKNQYSSWCKNGVLNVTKGNVDKLFKASKGEMINICGKPKVEKVDYLPNDEFYAYNGFTVGYFGGSSKYPWGPSQILFESGNSKLLGVKIGTSLKDAKKIVGKPLFEGIDEGDGDYLLIYRINGYEYYYYIGAGDKVYMMNVKPASDF